MNIVNEANNLLITAYNDPKGVVYVPFDNLGRLKDPQPVEWLISKGYLEFNHTSHRGYGYVNTIEGMRHAAALEAQRKTIVCKTCGLKVGYWSFGWKHQAGPGQKSCGDSPIPIIEQLSR